MRKQFLFLTLFSLFFLLLSVNVASADIPLTALTDAQLRQTSSDLGNAYKCPMGFNFNSVGNIIWCGNGTAINQFSLTSSYNINDTLSLTNTLDIRTGVINSSENETAVSMYVSKDGRYLFVGYQKSQVTRFGSIRQFNLTNPYDISSATQFLGNYTPTTAYFNKDNINFNRIHGLFLTPDGTKLYLTEGGITNYIQMLKLSTPYSLNTYSINSTAQLTGDGATGSPISQLYVTDDGNYIIGSSGREKLFNFNFPFDVNSLVLVEIRNILGGTETGAIDVRFSGDKGFLYIEQAPSTFKEYQFNVTNNPFNFTEGNQSTGLLTGAVNPLLSVFPDSSTLSSRQKWSFVFITMLILAFIILGTCAYIKLDSYVLPLIILLILEGVLFFFFVSIGYIGFGIVITLILTLILALFLIIKGRGV